MSKNQGQDCAEYYYDLGKTYYEGINTYRDLGDYVNQQKCASIAPDIFWLALVMGSYKAPYPLFALFIDGIGVEKNEEAAQIMLGVARKLDSEYENEPIIIPDNLQPTIDGIYSLLVEAHEKFADVSDEGANLGLQLDRFREVVFLSNGKTIEDYLFSTQDPSEIANGDIQLAGEHDDNEANTHHHHSKKGNCEIL